MSKEEMREEGGKKAVITGTQSIWRFPEQGNILRARSTAIRPATSESFSRVQDQVEQLFPGLSNDIVLDEIVPKLPWRTVHRLSSVSRSWRQAIRSHQVFEARRRSHSTETMLLLNFTHSINITPMGVHALCLYSVKEKKWHRLPDFPYKRIVRGVPNRCGCVSLDGKIYVLGGNSEDEDCQRDSREVHVLDLAGQTGWRQCASMLEPRQSFAYGVIDGKIYVAGGASCGKTIRRCEVYDPKENAWSSISPMISTRAEHKFVTVGEELWLYGGSFYDRDCKIFRCDGNKAEDDPSSRRSWYDLRNSHAALSPEVYRPSTGEWELVKTLEVGHMEILFAAQGKLHSMGYNSICVDDGDDDGCWTELYSFSFPGVKVGSFLHPEPFAAYPVNGELFALVSWVLSEEEITFYQSKGFGKENDEIMWEKLDHPFSGEDSSPEFGPPCGGEGFMFPVQL